MTEKANPSPNRPADAFSTAGAIAYGGSVNGFIVDSTDPTDIAKQDSDIDESTFNSFEATTSNTSITVNISPGEGFVFGSWLAIDTETSVTLNSSTTDQTVYLGWDKNTSNDVIIGLSSEFSSLDTDTDQRIPLFDFDTDNTGVTSTTDRRQIGRAQDLALLSVANELDVPVYSDSTNGPQKEGAVIAIDGGGSQTAGLYSHDGSSYIKAGKTEEAIEDIVAGLIAAGTDISINYDDANNTLTINNTAGYTDENAQDTIASALTGDSKIGITYDDPNNTIAIDTTALDAEEVENQVNTLLSAGSNVNLTYDDANDTLSIASEQRTQEEIEDFVDGLISSGTNIVTSYDDLNGVLDINLRSTGTYLQEWYNSTGEKRADIDNNGNMRIEGEITEGATL